jgi:hypothetical protein
MAREKKLKKYDVRFNVTIMMDVVAASAKEAEDKAADAYDSIASSDDELLQHLGIAGFGYEPASEPEARLEGKW